MPKGRRGKKMKDCQSCPQRLSEEQWSRYIIKACQISVREQISCLGLKMKTSRGPPTFSNPICSFLADKISILSREMVDFLRRDGGQLTHDLLEFATSSDLLQEKVENLLNEYGPQIWGRKIDRSHLKSEKTGDYERDLFYENAEDRKILKLGICQWVIASMIQHRNYLRKLVKRATLKQKRLKSNTRSANSKSDTHSANSENAEVDVRPTEQPRPVSVPQTPESDTHSASSENAEVDVRPTEQPRPVSVRQTPTPEDVTPSNNGGFDAPTTQATSAISRQSIPTPDFHTLQREVTAVMFQFCFPQSSMPPDEAALLRLLRTFWLHGESLFRAELCTLYDLVSETLTAWLDQRGAIAAFCHSIAENPVVPKEDLIHRVLGMNELRAMRIKWKNLSPSDGMGPEDLLCMAFKVMTKTEGSEHLFKERLERLDLESPKFLHVDDHKIAVRRCDTRVT